MSVSETTIYEIHVRRGDAWQFDMSTADQEDAIAEAVRLASKGASTKVTREVYCEKEGIFRSNTIFKSDKPKQVTVSSVAPKRVVGPARVAARPQAAAKKGFFDRLFG
jgi:hypothetical protein